MTTNVPLPQFTPTGLVIASEQAILAGIQADYVAAFAQSGKALSTDLTTPQGQLQSSQAYMVAAFQAALAYLISQVDPVTSSGRFQDALGRIYYLTRQQATFATVAAVVTGVPGQMLPEGSQAKSADGTIWLTADDALYGAGGTAAITFVATTAGTGPECGINGLSINQQVPNWLGVANAAPSVPGLDTETRQEFEARRAASVEIGGAGQPANIFAAIANVPGVSDVFVYNNGGDDPITYGTTSFPIPAHSIAISVSGGDGPTVALAINSKLDCGCGMVTSGGLGTLVTYNIQDSTNYAPPYPTYPISFVRPLTKQVYITVNIADIPTIPATYVLLVQAAVAKAFADGYVSTDGTINISRARIGGQVIATEFAAPIIALGNTIIPVTIFIGFTAAPSSGASITLGIDEQPVCPALNITVNAIGI